MNFKVTFDPIVRKQIGECGFSRNAVVRLLADSRARLSTETHRYRHNRWPGRADCFLYRHILVDGDAWHRCEFVVEDHATPGELFVRWLFHEARPRKT